MKAGLGPRLMIGLLALLLSVAAFAESGEEVFKRKCAGCHGAHGAGDTTIGKHLSLRNLGSADVQKKTDQELLAIIAKGKSGKMPAYESKLSKDQISDLVKFIRILKK